MELIIQAGVRGAATAVTQAIVLGRLASIARAVWLSSGSFPTYGGGALSSDDSKWVKAKTNAEVLLESGPPNLLLRESIDC